MRAPAQLHPAAQAAEDIADGIVRFTVAADAEPEDCLTSLAALLIQMDRRWREREQQLAAEGQLERMENGTDNA
jgi:hypothetical protein